MASKSDMPLGFGAPGGAASNADCVLPVDWPTLSVSVDPPRGAGASDDDLSLGAGGAPGGGAAPFAGGCSVIPEPGGVSTLPRMSGRPSLLVPKMTIFALGDCASASVASMPRQRRYESEMPWLTVRWKAAMPVASICLRLDSCASRSTRNLYS